MTSDEILASKAIEPSFGFGSIAFNLMLYQAWIDGDLTDLAVRALIELEGENDEDLSFGGDI